MKHLKNINWKQQAEHSLQMLILINDEYEKFLDDEEFITRFANYLERFKGNATILDALQFADSYQ